MAEQSVCMVQGIRVYGGLQASWYDIAFAFSGIPGGGCNGSEKPLIQASDRPMIVTLWDPL